LDIKEAYDNVCSNVLFDLINPMKIPTSYKNFIKNSIRAVLATYVLLKRKTTTTTGAKKIANLDLNIKSALYK